MNLCHFTENCCFQSSGTLLIVSIIFFNFIFFLYVFHYRCLYLFIHTVLKDHHFYVTPRNTNQLYFLLCDDIVLAITAIPKSAA